MLIFYATSRVIDQSSPDDYKSQIVYLDLDLEKKTHKILDVFVIPNCHADSIVCCKNIIVVNNQTGDHIIILGILDEKIHMIDTLNGYDKPHGVDINYDNKLIAVSNYGDNTIKIREIPQNVLDFMVT